MIETTTTFRGGTGGPKNIRLFKKPIAAERLGGVKSAPGGVKMAGGFQGAGTPQVRDPKTGYLPRKQGWTGPGAAPVSEKSGGFVPSQATSAAKMGGALPEGGPSKSYGIDQGDQDNPHSYLGHFANDAVLRVGHNVGHKKKGGQAAVRGMAKNGYRKLPGSATVHQGNVRNGSLPDSAHGLKPTRFERAKSVVAKRALTRMMKGIGGMTMGGMSMASQASSMPPTTSSKALSIKHERDRVAFDEKHAADHKAGAAAARQKIKQLKAHKPPKG